MRAALLLCLLAIAAVAVTAQNTVEPAPAVGKDEYTPAIMTPAPASMKKPIIFDAEAASGAKADVDAPIIGKAPANLKKSVVTEHIYGGVVEFAKGRTAHGCRCRKQLPEKYRYDAQYKPDRNETLAAWRRAHPCGCHHKPAPKPEDALPPVVARLYPKRHNHTHTFNATHHCHNHTAPVVQKIAPAYYPKHHGPRARARLAARLAAHAPCAKNLTAPAPATVTPSFYPAHHRHHRKGKHHRKAAQKQSRKEARRQRRKERQQRRKERRARKAAARKERRARRAAKRAARKAAKEAAKKKSL